MEEQPLDGILVAVPATRRAAETEALIRRWGGTSLVGPLLEEVPVEDEAPLRTATEEVVAGPRRGAWFPGRRGWPPSAGSAPAGGSPRPPSGAYGSGCSGSSAPVTSSPGD